MTWQRIQALKRERAALVPKMREIHERAEKESRDLNTEERSEFDRLDKEVKDKGKEIETLERALEATKTRAAQIAELENESRSDRGRQTDIDPTSTRDNTRRHERDDRDDGDSGHQRRARTLRAGSDLVVRCGRVRVSALQGSAFAQTASDEYRAAFGEYLRSGRNTETLERLAHQLRGQTVQNQAEGGYLQVPMQFLAEMIADVDDAVIMRQFCRVLPPTPATSLGAPRRTGKASTANWGTELSEPTTDNSLRFGLRELSPHYMTYAAEISRALMYGSVMDVEAIVREELVRDAAELEERGFLTGDGVNKPLGVFTASDDGIPTSRDVSTGNATTTPTADGLARAFYSLKDVYRARSTWLMHRDVITSVILLKDGNGQYLFRMSAGADRPDTLFNRPVRSSEFAPNTLTTGQYVGIVGDFNNYWIIDGTEVQLQKLIETKAKSNRDEFIGRRKVDGAPTKGEAFARVKLA